MTMQSAALPPSSFPPPLACAIGGQRCWLHAGGTAHVVLMCGAHGYEGLATYHAWHDLASRLARRGLTAIRFDYPGEGDAADLADGTSAVEAAVEAIGRIHDCLRTMSGITTISVAGLRLGALLAVRALETRVVDRLALLQPPETGKSMIREMKAQARLMGKDRQEDTAADALALCGFSLSARDLDLLGAMRLAPLPPARAVLVAANGARMATLPDGAVCRLFDDYGAMMSALDVKVPVATFDAVADWLAVPPAGVWSGMPSPPPAPLAGDGWTEQPCRLGPEERLAAVLCAPEQHAAPMPIVIMPNAGGNPRHGWARMAVAHARALAGRGIASLRLDLSGLGDASLLGDSPRQAVYLPQHAEDLRIAVDHAVALGYRRVIVAGVCAGGHLAFHALDADPRVSAAIAVNVLKLNWTPADSLDAYETTALQSAARYRAQAVSAEAWKRILTGEIGPAKLWRVARMMAGRIATGMMDRAGLNLHLSDEAKGLRAKLRAISARGASITFVHSDADPSIDEAERQFGRGYCAVRALPGVSLERLGPSDHELTHKKARDRLLEIVADRALSR